MRPHDRCAAAFTLALIGASAAALRPARGLAQSRVTANDFTVELAQGPVLGGGRIVGLGGAFVALASGIEGASFTPASYGSRALHERDRFELDVDAGLLFPGSFSRNDYFMNGRSDIGVDEFLFFNAGVRVQLGRVGAGTIVDRKTFTVATSDGKVDVAATDVRTGLGFAVDRDGEALLGLGVRVSSLELLPSGSAAPLVEFSGSALELGLLYGPHGLPLRIGAAARTPVSSTDVIGGGVQDVDGVERAFGFVVPTGIEVPWELQVGAAIQVGPRPLQVHLDDDARPARVARRELAQARFERLRRETERMTRARGDSPGDRDDPYAWLDHTETSAEFDSAERRRRRVEARQLEERIEAYERADERKLDALARTYVLFTGELLVLGQTPHAIGLDAFLTQERRRAGRDVTYQARFGIESEVWPRRLKLRAGTYLESSRYETVSRRLHGTAGADLRLFRVPELWFLPAFDLQVRGVVDVAARYVNWGVSVGFWH